MIKTIKKRVFWIIAMQRKNALGRFLFSTTQSLLNALNNKINDSNLNGEYWVLQNLDHSQINVVFDVGANVGKWTSQLKKNIPKAKVFAFEPVPETFDELKKNSRQFDQVQSYRHALSDHSGQLDFFYFPNQNTFSSVYEHDLGKNAQKITVEGIIGDDFCEQNGIITIDFLKIDTEGFESKVLFGFKQMLNKKQIKLVQFEYGPMAIDSKFLLIDFYQFFESRGYQVGKIYPHWIDFRSYSKDMENFVLSNFVAVEEKSYHLIKKRLQISN